MKFGKYYIFVVIFCPFLKKKLKCQMEFFKA